MRLDEAIPRWDRREHHRVACDAPTAMVMRAAEEVTWREVPVFRGLMQMRLLGRTLPAVDEPVVSWFTEAGFALLARTEDELVVGGIERASRMRAAVPVGPFDLWGFRLFDEPGRVKIGFNFRYAAGELSTETRVVSTDARSRRLFGLYWFFIRGGSGLIRHVWLRAIRRRALRAVRRTGENDGAGSDRPTIRPADRPGAGW